MLSLWCSKKEFMTASQLPCCSRDRSGYLCPSSMAPPLISRAFPTPSPALRRKGYQGRSPWLDSPSAEKRTPGDSVAAPSARTFRPDPRCAHAEEGAIDDGSFHTRRTVTSATAIATFSDDSMLQHDSYGRHM